MVPFRIRMADEEGNSSAFSLVDGNYRVDRHWYTLMVVEGTKLIVKDPTGTVYDMNFKLGDFGEADPEIVETTDQKIYNIEFTYHVGSDFTDLGVISEDGLKITIKGMMGISVLQWITEEEAAALEAEGDPIDAPPCPYEIQPENLGKFLFITGPPCSLLSTTAQMLSKTSGYVYYEADCFGCCRNPYIPADAPEPDMAVTTQKPLKGEGLKERGEAAAKSSEVFGQLASSGDFDMDVMKQYYEYLCEDILKERNRIGGDWAVASPSFNKEMRDFIR